MTIDFTLTSAAQSLVDEVRDWAITYGRPLAREADRISGLPEGAAKVVRIMGNPDQIERWAGQALMSGGIGFTAFALSEPQSGSDASGLRTTATRDGDSWILNGSKVFNSGGATCDYNVVFATIEHKMGLRSWQTSAISFDNARIPLNNCLGIGTDKVAGYRGALHSLASSRPVAGMMSLGIAQAAVDTAQQAVASDIAPQATRRKERVAEEFARLNGALGQARLLCLRACRLFDQPIIWDAAALAVALFDPLAVDLRLV